MRGVLAAVVVGLLGVLAATVLFPWEPKSWQHIGPSGAVVDFTREEGSGTIKITSANEADFYWGVGLMHVYDRTTQLLLLRIIAQGRVSELLRSDNTSLAIDSFMREMGFVHEAAVGASTLSPTTKALVHSYCEGVNYFLTHYSLPLELRLLGVAPEPWTPADVLLIVKIMAWLPLAEVQRDVEAFILHAFQSDIPPGIIKRLFTPFLDGVTDELISIYKQIRLEKSPIPEEIQLMANIPRAKASNNWVLSPSRSSSNAAIGACDPHLDTARLPAIWYELKGVVADKPRFGISVPGVPGLMFGRTKELFWSFTYGFMDTVDLFIEDIKREDDAYYYRRGQEWKPVKLRKETILRKGMEPVEMDVLEADHCLIETRPLYNGEIVENGLYVCRAWSNAQGGMAESLESLLRVGDAKRVEEAQEIAQHISLPANHLFADIQGNIGYQQSGKLPNRKSGWSGLYPLPSWETENHWTGFAPGHQMIRVTNPPSGYLATANNDIIASLSEEEKARYPLSQNLWMGYRIDRIHHLFSQKDKFSAEEFKKMHFDVYSLQAEEFMTLIHPQLEALSSFSSSPAYKALINWDYKYDVNSTGAPVFANIYNRLFDEFYGKKIFGEKTWEAVKHSGVVADFFYHYDRFFLTYGPEDPFSLFSAPGETKETFLRGVVQATLSVLTTPLPTWGKVREVKMRNILFDGALPPFLGADEVIQQAGTGATIQQGSLYVSKGRTVTFAPSWRAVVDLSKDEIDTTLPGGPSGNFLSSFYKTGIEGWLNGVYQKILLE